MNKEHEINPRQNENLSFTTKPTRNILNDFACFTLRPTLPWIFLRLPTWTCINGILLLPISSNVKINRQITLYEIWASLLHDPI